MNLQDIRQMQKTRKRETDEILSEIVLRQIPTRLRSLDVQTKALLDSLRELGTPISFVRAKNLYNYRALLEDATKSVSSLSDSVLLNLGNYNRNIYSAGIDDGSWLLAEQFPVVQDDRDRIMYGLISNTPKELPKSKDVTDAMQRKFETFPYVVRDYLSEKLEDAVSASFDPRGRVIAAIDTSVGTSTAWITNMTSMALWSFYTMGILALAQHSQLSNGWMWLSRLDAKTCMACILRHGNIFPLHEELRDHPHGRCVPFPLAIPGDFSVLGAYVPTMRNGEFIEPELPEIGLRGDEWFAGLDASIQESILGPSAMKAWKDDAIRLHDLGTVVEHDVYGTMVTVPSLKSLIGEESKKYDDRSIISNS